MNHAAELPMECAIAIWNSLKVMPWKEGEQSGIFGYQAQLHEESISFLTQACVLSMEKLFKDLHQFKEVSHVPAV